VNDGNLLKRRKEKHQEKFAHHLEHAAWNRPMKTRFLDCSFSSVEVYALKRVFHALIRAVSVKNRKRITAA